MNAIAKIGHNRSAFDLAKEKIEDLYSTFSYDPDTGEFQWLRNVGQRGRIGEPAGGVWSDKSGKSYVVLTLNRQRYPAHCVAHLFMTGRWPAGEIDHRDGNGLNNRWLNLREGTKSQNQANARRRRDNSSGYKGVSLHAASGKFCARIQCRGRRINLGLYETPQEAHAAYVHAANSLFGEFARAA